MHDPAFERHPCGDTASTGGNCSLADDRPAFGLRCSGRTRHIAVHLALAIAYRCGIGVAEPGGCFDHCVQHRLHIGGRAADDLEHVAGRGLVFERFLEVVGAGLQFAIGLGAGDGDDRLLGKGLQQCDLAVREAADLDASHRHRADRRAVAQQRQRYLRLVTEIANGRADSGCARHVAHMNGLPVENRPASDGTARRHHRKQPHVGFHCLGRAVRRGDRALNANGRVHHRIRTRQRSWCCTDLAPCGRSSRTPAADRPVRPTSP